MRPQLRAVLLLLCLAVAACSAQSFERQSAEPDIEVLGPIEVRHEGYTFQGEVLNVTSYTAEHKVIHRFRRVPYAQPPTGDRRFAKPEPLNFATAVTVDATKQAPLCPQDNSTKGIPYDEDCLFFNVWTPTFNSSIKYPVLVYIHGGRLETGGIADPENQGETFLRNQDVVLITINFRLGATGFLYLDDGQLPGNFGLLDQRLALKTIATLASKFGGDPDKITLAGHGTGAASVGFHITTKSLPLTRAIMMGGSPLMPLVWSNDNGRVRALSESFVNIQLNCARGEGRLAEVIDCLRKNVSIGAIIENQKIYERLFTSLEFMPVLDREFFNLHDPLSEWGNLRKNVTIMMGVAGDSGSEFVDNSLRSRNLTIEIMNRTVYYEILRRQFVFYPRFPTLLDDTGLKFLQLSHTEWNDIYEKELLRNMWSRALGDFNFLCPTLYALFDDFRPKPGDDMKTYLYYFNAPDHIRSSDPGHENDVRYFFGIPDGPGIPYPLEHNILSKRMMNDMANFVKGEKPNTNWDSVIAGEWNYNNYILNEDAGLYNLTGGFAIRRCRWWHETLSFVNRLAPATSAAPQLPSHLRGDPFHLDEPAAEVTLAAPAAAFDLPVMSTVVGNVTVTLPGVNAKITGNELRTAGGKELNQFLGIPYAKPPTESLRFSKPEKHDLSAAEIIAHQMPKACTQAYGKLEESEDCLYLNIWAPKLITGTQVPVFVYIHGGFFEVGGINDPTRSGEKLVELKDVVVVTIGYRLGALGFLSFVQDGSRGNFGLFDQEMALKWVDEHISAFGGNSSLITLIGDDAGAVSVGYHMIRNTTGFSRAILQTGSPSLAYPLSDNQEDVRLRVRQFLGLIGCNHTSPSEQLSCMRAKSVTDIRNVYTNQFVNKFGPEALVTIDGDFLREDPWLSVQKGNMKEVPLIVGFVDRPGNEIIQRRVRYGEINLANITADDAIQNVVAASYYNPRKPKELKAVGANLIAMQYRSPLARRQVVIDSLSEAYSDRFYTCGNNEYLYQVTVKRNQLDAHVFHYVFTEKSNIEGITAEGAGLSEDTFYLFGNPLLGSQWSNEQKNLSTHMMDLFVRFAETGNPNPETQLDLWYEYTTNRKPYLILDADVYNVSVNWGFRINDCGFWQEVLPYVNTLTEPIITPEPPPTTRPPIGPEGIIIDEIIIEIDFLAASRARASIKGDVIQLPNGKNITRFLGVPYAKPPLRFAQAELPTLLDVDARKMPPACPQLIQPAGANMSEDCLYINIWAPTRSAQLYPVAVFLHGGNYTSGANSLSEYRGEQLLESQDVILVSVNYRLGALGFLHLDDEKLPGNFGLMDQRLALDFIQRVIPAFGGNKSRVTLIGHGTDAASAAFHAVTDSKSSFDRMILMGGSPSMPLAWSSSTEQVRIANERFVNVQLDCARGPLDQVLACLRGLPLQRIMTEQLNMYNSLDHLVFVPVFSKAFFNNVHPYTLWSEGKVEKPFMTGVGSDSGRYYTEQSLARRNISWESLNRTVFENIIDRQFSYFPRFPMRNQATGLQFLKLALTEWNYFDYNKRIKAIWSRAMGDFNFLCPIWEAVSDVLRTKSHPIHMYYIDVEDPFRGAEDLNGADHWGDIRYLFGDPFRRDGYPEAHKKISRIIMDDFVQYMKGSAPERWNATSLKTADFMFYDVLQSDSGGSGTEIAAMVGDGFGLNSGRCPLWKNELPYVNTLTKTTADDDNTKSLLQSIKGQQNVKAPGSSNFNLDSIIRNYSISATDFGTIWGQIVKTHSNVTMSQFLGIPYAKPPTGNLRFAKPEKPVTTSATVHLALHMPPMCIQKKYYGLPMAEDCLYLNIWTPKQEDKDASDLPVLVFLPGGFFEVGGSSEARWHGSMILDHHDAVVVTINYRLGVFGFLSLDDKVIKGNYGLFDQEMALQWVADHIDKFGGNKNRITVMGVEAGAVSIGYHMARKPQNRFHQVIMMTGSPYMSYPLSSSVNEVHRLHGVFVRNLMRCESANELQCIRDFNATELNELQTLFQLLFTGIEFSPVLDGEFIMKDPWQTDPSELMHVPMIFGGVDRPGNFFIERISGSEMVTPENFTHDAYLNALQYMNDYFPRFPTQMTSSGVMGLRNHFMQYNQQGNFQRDIRDLGLALSDRYFTCANNRFIDAYSKASTQPVYNYLFTEGKMYDEPKLPLDHASLFEDAYYAFGNPSSPGPPRPNEQTRLSDAFMESIVTFANSSIPSSLLKWDRYHSSNKSHLLLDADVLPPTMFQDGNRRQECGFWDHTLTYVNGLTPTSTPQPSRPTPTRPPIGPDGLVLGNATVVFNGVSIIGQRVLVPNGLKNISRFLGVPYALPPVNERRFAEPQQHPLAATVIAQTLPPACPQDNRTLNIPYSEDCLYLNIWTPNARSGSNYPTIVYIHGGNFESGSISQRELFGETLLSHQDVVLFTMAYRLGSLGFLYLDDGALPGNAGLLDQRLALQTVTQLVEAFGGNRQSITLAGHGMGAAAVGFHSVTSSNGGFKRAVLMGGSPTMPMAWYDSADGKDRTRLLNRAFVDFELNCIKGSLTETIACIRQLDVKTIVDAQTPFLKLLHSLEFRPVLDRTFFENRDPLVAWRNQEFANVEMLMGFTTETGGSYVDQALRNANRTIANIDTATYRRILNETFRYYPRFPRQLSETGREFIYRYLDDYVGRPDKYSLRDIWSQATGDRYFLCPVWESIVQKGRNRSSTDTYLYVFTARDPFDGEKIRFGSDHHADLQYFFGLPAGTGAIYPNSHTKLSERMMRDLVQFAKDGRPNTSWQKTKLGVWDYADYNDNYEYYNATEGAKTIQRCGVWYYDLPFVDGLVESSKNVTMETKKLPSQSDKKLPDLFAATEPRPKYYLPTNIDKVLRNYTISVSGYGQVAGRTVMTLDNNTISEFLGLRYAEPPVGRLRFRKPAALVNAGDGVVHNAHEMGASCYQRKYYSLSMSEDCLFLNIWTPRHSENLVSGLPVIVFIHGGFFEVGSSSEPRWNGQNILDHEQAVIVTINYRLGAYGFLSLDSSVASGITGNMGLFDQETAISWVAKNIEAFGGDKDKVTLAGVEAGSISIGYHLIRQPIASKPFSKVIMMTGSPMQSYPLSDKTDVVRQYHAEFVRSSSRLNCSSNTDACLQALSASFINEKQEEFNRIFRGVEFQPIIDKDFLQEDPWALVRSGSFAKMPMIIGQTSSPGNFLLERIVGNVILNKDNFTLEAYRSALVESNTFFPRFPTQMTTSGQEILKLFKSPWSNLESFDLKIQEWAEALSDRYFTCDITEFTDIYAKQNGNSTYYFVFAEKGLFQSDHLPLIGSTLFEDAYYFFGNPTSPGPPASRDQAKLSEAVMKRFVKFARDGNPNANAGAPSWRSYGSGLKNTKIFLALGTERYPEVMHGFRRQECGWWESVLPYVDDLVFPTTTTAITTVTTTRTTSTSTPTTTTTSTSTPTRQPPGTTTTSTASTAPTTVTTSRPPIGPDPDQRAASSPDAGYYALVTIVPILGIALIAGAVFILVKVVTGASVAVAPAAAGAAATGTAFASAAAAETGGTAAAAAASSSAAGPSAAQHAEVVNEAFQSDAANSGDADADADAGNTDDISTGNRNASGSTTNL